MNIRTGKWGNYGLPKEIVSIFNINMAGDD